MTVELVVKGTAYWAHLAEPSDMSGKYQIDISLDDESLDKVKKAVAQEAKEVNAPDNFLKVATEKGVKSVLKNLGDDRGTFISASSEKKVKVMDIRKNVLPDDMLIGNGSVVKAGIRIKGYSNNYGKGVGCYLVNVMVVKYEEYGGMDLTEEEDGFVFEGSSPQSTTQTPVENDFDDSLDDLFEDAK